MDSWNEVLTACDPNINVVQSISAIAFDPCQELLWTGNDKQLLVSDRGVISLSSDSVKMTNRRGLVRWAISNEDTTDLRCMTYTTMPNSEILAAGRRQSMLVINIARGTVVKKVESESEIVVMRKSRLVCYGSTSGEVTLRDPRTFKVEHRIQAHTGAISDIDTTGNLLLTCGFSARLANAGYVSAVDLSKSGEMLAFGDAVSMIHVWSDRKNPKINAYSNPVELPAVPGPTSNVFVGENE
ncbi:10143_t:CDS:2 [Acaulospora colombiana]|uniref:10143_t:CDS:1 n=1 Tax=Acaulospora colombiana TaxID=27376 RepID=A0ACA9LQX6_9GLOM|nr:10143_t:CDS:2 [Acaulospora colombiana]